MYQENFLIQQKTSLKSTLIKLIPLSTFIKWGSVKKQVLFPKTATGFAVDLGFSTFSFTCDFSLLNIASMFWCFSSGHIFSYTRHGSVSPPQLVQTIGWNAKIFCTDIHGPQNIHLNDSPDLYWLHHEADFSLQQLDGLLWNLVQISKFYRLWCSPWFYLYAHQQVKVFTISIYWNDCRNILYRHSWFPGDFGDPPIYRLAPPWGSHLRFWVLNIFYWISKEFATGIHVPLRMNSEHFGNSVTFYIVPLGQIFHFTNTFILSNNNSKC